MKVFVVCRPSSLTTYRLFNSSTGPKKFSTFSTIAKVSISPSPASSVLLSPTTSTKPHKKYLQEMAWRNMISFCPRNLGYMFQARPDEIELGCQYYVKTHGKKLLKDHMHDWLILILLVVIEIVLNVIHPFYRFVGAEMMTDLRYPFQDNTVPVWAVPIYAVLLPIFIFTLYYLVRRDVYDLHHSVLGLLFAVLITGVLTDAVKDAVGRPRPDFFWRCFPDGQANYDRLGNVICTGNDRDIREGHKSFPSGHTSWSFAGLGFLALYLAGKIECFDRRGHVAKLCLIFLPILAACLVGVSRVDDYWHHWQDVFAGGILGLVVATMCYLQFFPPPYQTEGYRCYAFARAREETRSTRNGTSAQVTNQQVAGMNDYQVDNGDLTLDSVELGSRY